MAPASNKRAAETAQDASHGVDADKHRHINVKSNGAAGAATSAPSIMTAFSSVVSSGKHGARQRSAAKGRMARHNGRIIKLSRWRQMDIIFLSTRRHAKACSSVIIWRAIWHWMTPCWQYGVMRASCRCRGGGRLEASSVNNAEP